jgi:hypothetical protein
MDGLLDAGEVRKAPLGTPPMTASPGLLAESAKNSGLPSEEEIAAFLKLRDEMVTDPDERTDDERRESARAILDLIRPATEREIDRYEAMIKREQDAAIYWCGEAAKLNERALAAEAALAAERERKSRE